MLPYCHQRVDLQCLHHTVVLAAMAIVKSTSKYQASRSSVPTPHRSFGSHGTSGDEDTFMTLLRETNAIVKSSSKYQAESFGSKNGRQGERQCKCKGKVKSCS